jgi:hypothetical protein
MDVLDGYQNIDLHEKCLEMLLVTLKEIVSVLVIDGDDFNLDYVIDEFNPPPYFQVP